MDILHKKKILLIDDDPYLLELVTHIFTTNTKARVSTASNGLEGLRQFFDQRPDLVILDLMMPKMDGWAVCAQIRQLANIPVILLTASSKEEDIVRGLDGGAVDFITKPVKPEILLARVRAALRQASGSPFKEKPKIYHDQYLTIDLTTNRVMVQNRPVKLSATELRLLTYLYQNAGQVLSLAQILSYVWGDSYQNNVEYVHVYASHLRKKLERNPKKPEYLLTEHGVGYRFDKKS